MKKRLLITALIALLTLLLSLCISAEEYDFEYKINEDNTYSVVGIGTYKGTNLVIPAEHLGLPVTKIEDKAFFDNETITGLVLPDTVTSIGEEAFHYCIKLEKIELGNGVRNIGFKAFYFCTSLEDVSLGNSLQSIGEQAFYNCIAIDTLIIPDSVSFIGDKAFKYCDNLIQLTLGKGLETIEAEAFVNCHKLVEVYNLSDIAIGASSPEGGYAGAFSMAIHTSLDEKSILTYTDGGYAFAYANGKYYLVSQMGFETELTLPERINGSKYEIARFAFNNRATLEKIDLGTGVTAIGNGSFNFCARLKYVKVNEGVTKIGAIAFGDCHELVGISLPKTLKSIGFSAFQCCFNLMSIKIPEGVEAIEDTTFLDCKSLLTVELPQSLKTIGAAAFVYCESLVSVTIPKGVNIIGSQAFAGCLSLARATIPSTVTYVGDSAFLECPKLKIYCRSDSSIQNGWSASWNLENRPVQWSYSITVGDVLEFLGYSTNGKMICAGFSIDKNALWELETTSNNEIEFGIVCASFELLDGRQPLDKDGNPTQLEQGKVLKASLRAFEYVVYDFILADLTSDLYNHRFVVAGYVYDGSELVYVQGTPTDTVKGVSYKDMVTSINESTEDEAVSMLL